MEQAQRPLRRRGGGRGARITAPGRDQHKEVQSSLDPRNPAISVLWNRLRSCLSVVTIHYIVLHASLRTHDTRQSRGEQAEPFGQRVHVQDFGRQVRSCRSLMTWNCAFSPPLASSAAISWAIANAYAVCGVVRRIITRMNETPAVHYFRQCCSAFRHWYRDLMSHRRSPAVIDGFARSPTLSCCEPVNPPNQPAKIAWPNLIWIHLLLNSVHGRPKKVGVSPCRTHPACCLETLLLCSCGVDPR